MTGTILMLIDSISPEKTFLGANMTNVVLQAGYSRFPNAFRLTSWAVCLCTRCAFILFCARVWDVCLLCWLTSDHGCDLVPAGPDAILDLTDESGVDRVIHLQHLQLFACDLHDVWHLSWHTAGIGAYQRENEGKKGGEEKKENGIAVCLTLGTMRALRQMCIWGNVLYCAMSSNSTNLDGQRKTNQFPHFLSSQSFIAHWRKTAGSRPKNLISPILNFQTVSRFFPPPFF